MYVKATAIRTCNYGSYEVNTTWAPSRKTLPRPSTVPAAYEEAGIGPEDVDVIQVQDTDAGAEVIHMAENGFRADGDQEKLLADGATEITGPMPINTDGGLIANGEPIGASASARSTNWCSSSATRPAIAKSRVTRASAMPRSTGFRHRRSHDPRPLRAAGIRSRVKGGAGRQLPIWSPTGRAVLTGLDRGHSWSAGSHRGQGAFRPLTLKLASSIRFGRPRPSRSVWPRRTDLVERIP